MAVVDSLIIYISVASAVLLHYDLAFSAAMQSEYWVSFNEYAVLFTIFSILIFALFEMYSSLWQYAGHRELFRVLAGAAFTAVALHFFASLYGLKMARGIYISYTFIASCLFICIRFAKRFLVLILRYYSQERTNKKRTMLIGAGSAGLMVINDLKNSKLSQNNVVCIIDDDPKKQGRRLGDVIIAGGRETIAESAKKYKIEEIIFAIPSAPVREVGAILHLCEQTGCRVKKIPSLVELANGKVDMSNIRSIQIEDLLGRQEVKTGLAEVVSYLQDKTVLVTGGGGSVGSELCRQIAPCAPKQLIIFDIYENNAYDLQQELLRKHPELDLKVVIGSVREEKTLDEMFGSYRPDIVFHAAAHKHVPLMEDNPLEAVKNNIFGTSKVANAAIRHGVSKFVLVSTDKAVNPTNVMGASKRACELIIRMLNDISDTEFVAVRFGNVLGSNGSVIPLFQRQIAAGGPVTVTDRRIIRYFMTIPEAASLILQAGAFAHGGEVFVLDMGKPIRVDELARRMIRLCGLEPDVDIKIKYIGLRPGEKLYEELLVKKDELEKTDNELIFIDHQMKIPQTFIAQMLKQLREAVDKGDCDAVRAALRKYVVTYKDADEVNGQFIDAV